MRESIVMIIPTTFPYKMVIDILVTLFPPNWPWQLTFPNQLQEGRDVETLVTI